MDIFCVLLFICKTVECVVCESNKCSVKSEKNGLKNLIPHSLRNQYIIKFNMLPVLRTWVYVMWGWVYYEMVMDD